MNTRSLEVPAGELVKITAVGDIRITNASLGDELGDQNGRTVLKLIYEQPTPVDDDEDDDEEELEPKTLTTTLCALTPGKVCHILRFALDRTKRLALG